jgi:hypothetical protein
LLKSGGGRGVGKADSAGVRGKNRRRAWHLMCQLAGDALVALHQAHAVAVGIAHQQTAGESEPLIEGDERR